VGRFPSVVFVATTTHAEGLDATVRAKFEEEILLTCDHFVQSLPKSLKVVWPQFRINKMNTIDFKSATTITILFGVELNIYALIALMVMNCGCGLRPSKWKPLSPSVFPWGGGNPQDTSLRSFLSNMTRFFISSREIKI